MNQKKLRIAMVIDTLDSKGGGIISTKRFIDLLRKEGHEVVVISTGSKENNKVLLPKFYPPFGKKIMKKMKIVFAWPIEEKINKAIENVDLVHVQLPFYLSIKTIELAEKKNLPIVSSFHVQAENITQNLKINSQKMINQIYKFFVNKIYNKSDLVICPSLFAEEELKKYGLKAPSKIISNGYTEEFSPQIFKKKYATKFVLLMVGRLAAEKHQEKIIEAVTISKHKKNIKLILVGNGPLKQQLKNLCRKKSCKAVFLHNISTKKLVRLYNTSELYVHSGEVELEGMTILEAMACGLPPLISNAEKSASKQFALDERSLFEKNKIVDLAAKIDYWYEHRLELLKAKEKYLDLAKQFNIKASVKKLEETYEEAIKLKTTKRLEERTNQENGSSWTNFLQKISLSKFKN